MRVSPFKFSERTQDCRSVLAAAEAIFPEESPAGLKANILSDMSANFVLGGHIW